MRGRGVFTVGEGQRPTKTRISLLVSYTFIRFLLLAIVKSERTSSNPLHYGIDPLFSSVSLNKVRIIVERDLARVSFDSKESAVKS